MDRVRVVITTRPIPVDRQLIELHLAIPPEKGEAVAARALMLNYRRSPEYKFPGAETSAWAFHNLEGLLPICVPVDASSSPYLLAETPPERGTLRQEANMGEVVRFVSKAERERLRLIREARAMYDSVFPSSPSINAHRDKPTIAQTVNGSDVRYGDNNLP
jgi:hypothetical protein